MTNNRGLKKTQVFKKNLIKIRKKSNIKIIILNYTFKARLPEKDFNNFLLTN